MKQSKINASLTTALFPNKSHERTLPLLLEMLGPKKDELQNKQDYISLNDTIVWNAQYLQICPQTSNLLTEKTLNNYQKYFKEIRFHANLRLLPQATEAYCYTENPEYWSLLKRWIQKAQSKAYTLHPGKRIIPITKIVDHQKRLEDTLGIKVGIEGLYPESKSNLASNHWLLSNWKEYQWLLDAKIPFAIDCSHLQIVAQFEKKKEMSLFSELLESEFCIEIHVSDNDGFRDNHQPLIKYPWWSELLNQALKKRTARKIENVVFCESNVVPREETFINYKLLQSLIA